MFERYLKHFFSDFRLKKCELILERAAADVVEDYLFTCYNCNEHISTIARHGLFVQQSRFNFLGRVDYFLLAIICRWWYMLHVYEMFLKMSLTSYCWAFWSSLDHFGNQIFFYYELNEIDESIVLMLAKFHLVALTVFWHII